MNRIHSLAITSLLVCLILISHIAQGNVPDVRLEPSPDWIVKMAIPTDQLQDKSAISGGEYFLLVDEQINALSSKSRYRHYAIKLENENAVTANSRITLNFSPDYQTLAIHEISLWRAGVRIKQNLQGKIKLLQREQELENLIYDGRWSATVLLEDVRKGDILEYSYSITGSHPAYHGHIGELIRLQWTVPVAHQFVRLLWPDSKPLKITEVAKNKLNLVLSKHEGFREYRIEQRHYPTLQASKEAPAWFDPWDRIAFSSTLNWQAVADWGVDLYKLDDKNTPEVKALISRIRRQYDGKLKQASAALHFVQDEIRYVGIEVGVGSYVPSKAEQTLKRRYGDCKDKTYLLLTLLKGLGIEAYPVLANTDYGENLGDDGPRLNAFNHVLVNAVLDGQSYWLETTTTSQLSTLDRIFQPDYGQVLVLKKDTRDLQRMPVSSADHQTIYYETFDLSAGVNKEAIYTVRSVLFGNDAEKFRRSVNAKGLAKITREYQDYYAKYYDSIEPVTDIEINYDNSNNRVEILEQYRIADFWEQEGEKRKFTASFYANSLYPYLQKPKMTRRPAPYQYSFPVNIEQNIKVILPEQWNLDDEHKAINSPFFKYSHRIRYSEQEKILYLQYKYQSLVKYIAETKLDEFINTVEEVNKNLDFSIYWNAAANITARPDPQSVAQAEKYEKDWLSASNIILVILGIFIFVIIYSYAEYRINKKHAPPAQNIRFYPVSSFKVFALSIVTFGLYLVYWFYCNWQYVKLRDHSKIMPWGRAIFYSFWLYPLYRSISNEQDVSMRVSSKEPDYRVLLLALIFLVSSFLINIDHVASYLALLLLSASILPLVEKINHLNPAYSEVYRFNSKWRSRHILFATLFMLLATLNISTSLNIIPDDTVVSGDALWRKDIRHMHRIGVLSPADRLILFYSDSLFSFKEDGNGLSTSGVFSYWRDEASGYLYKEKAGFGDIADIKYIPDEPGASSIQITRKDGTSFIVYSNDNNKHNFYIELKRYWDSFKGLR